MDELGLESSISDMKKKAPQWKAVANVKKEKYNQLTNSDSSAMCQEVKEYKLPLKMLQKLG